MANQTQGKCSKWHAIHHRVLNKPQVLEVTGECEFPTTGYKVALREAVPQGINPSELILEKIVTSPTGPVSEVITKVPVRWSKNTATKFDRVDIAPDGIHIKVEVAM